MSRVGDTPLTTTIIYSSIVVAVYYNLYYCNLFFWEEVSTMSERNNKLELLGSAPIPKALMALGIPIMIGMLINALYNLVDAYFVGRSA